MPKSSTMVYRSSEVTPVAGSTSTSATWQPLQNDSPASPVYGLVVQEHFNDLVVGTYGRGFWILDDITPLQQLTSEVVSSEAHLFKPRQAYRFLPTTGGSMRMRYDAASGEEPPEGAFINYWLSNPDGLEEKVQLQIKNALNQTIRIIEGTKDTGINRVWWDLEGEPSNDFKLRTKPLYADWVDLGDERMRGAPGVGRISVLEPPGTYTVVLQVEGKEYSQKLEVLKDPHSEGTPDDIHAQTEMVRQLQGDLNTVVKVVNGIERIRLQLGDLKDLVAEIENAEEIISDADELGSKLIAVEEKLLQLKRTGTGSDTLRWPTRLAGRIAYLASAVAVADFPPTDSHREVHQVLKGRLQECRRELRLILRDELPSFNQILQESELPRLVTGW